MYNVLINGRKVRILGVKPILFNTDMVLAILDGRKTVTRRVAKKIPIETHWTEPVSDGRFECRWGGNMLVVAGFKDGTTIVEPPYQPGDILYVRETWAEWTGGYLYKAWNSPSAQPERSPVMIWHPSIHMPKEAARIWLNVKDVRAERLCNMTLDDFLSEGVSVRPEAFNDPENAYMQARAEFIAIWDSTIPKRQQNLYGWTANPWVWAVEFETCERPVFAG